MVLNVAGFSLQTVVLSVHHSTMPTVVLSVDCFTVQTIESSPTEESPDSALSSQTSPERQSGRGLTPETGQLLLPCLLSDSLHELCNEDNC